MELARMKHAEIFGLLRDGLAQSLDLGAPPDACQCDVRSIWAFFTRYAEKLHGILGSRYQFVQRLRMSNPRHQYAWSVCVRKIPDLPNRDIESGRQFHPVKRLNDSLHMVLRPSPDELRRDVQILVPAPLQLRRRSQEP